MFPKSMLCVVLLGMLSLFLLCFLLPNFLLKHAPGTCEIGWLSSTVFVPRSSGSVSSTSHTRRSWNVHVMDQVVGMAANGTSVRAPFSVSRRSLTLLFHASSEFAATVNPGTSVLWYASKVCLLFMYSALFLQWRWKWQLLNSTSQS